MEPNDRLELFFSQSLDGFFFMMLYEPIVWNDSIDKEKTLDYVFEHQRITKVNDALMAQYGAPRDVLLGMTPTDLFRHDLAYGRKIWREFFDRGRLHIETDERRVDGTPIPIEGDYLCFYDDQGRITGHFGIQRDVTERNRADGALRRYNRRLQTLHDIHLDILGSRSSHEIAQAFDQQIRGDAGEPVAQIRIAARPARQQLAHDQEGPAVANQVQRPGDGAVLPVRPHGANVPHQLYLINNKL